MDFNVTFNLNDIECTAEVTAIPALLSYRLGREVKAGDLICRREPRSQFEPGGIPDPSFKNTCRMEVLSDTDARNIDKHGEPYLQHHNIWIVQVLHVETIKVVGRNGVSGSPSISNSSNVVHGSSINLSGGDFRIGDG